MRFESDYDDADFQPDEPLFLERVRGRCARREMGVDPDDTIVFPAQANDAHGRRELLLVLTVSDDEPPMGLLTFGAFFGGTTVVASELHWVCAIAAWPVERREWDKDGRTLIRQWHLPRCGRVLTSVPDWLTEAPTRTVHVRGEHGALPAGPGPSSGVGCS